MSSVFIGVHTAAGGSGTINHGGELSDLARCEMQSEQLSEAA